MSLRTFGFRALFLTVSLLLLASGVVGLGKAISNQPLLDTARSIAGGERLSAEYLDSQDIQSPTVSFDLTCLPEHARAVARFHLAALDTRLLQVRSGTLDRLEKIDQAFANAIAALEQSLLCAPTDGHAWLRLAMVLTEAEGPSERALAALERSWWMAPNEAWVIRIRARFASFLTNSRVDNPIVAEVLNADALTLSRAGRQQDVAYFVETGGFAAQQALRQALAVTDPEKTSPLQELLDSS